MTSSQSTEMPPTASAANLPQPVSTVLTPQVEAAVAPPVPATTSPPAPGVPQGAALFPTSVARAIIAVQSEIGKIAKEGWNQFQRYKYVKWEDISARLSPLLAEHGLIIHQSEIERGKLDSSGAVLSIVYAFTVISADTGEFFPPIRWTGLARLVDAKGTIDDKAAAKCHTQAEKYACIKLFKIVVDDAIDGDADGAGRPPPQAKPDAMKEILPPLTPEEKLRLQNAAREAARAGKSSLAMFWANLSDIREQDAIRQIAPELIALRDVAEKQLEQEFTDPDHSN